MIKAITFDFWNTLYKGPADDKAANKRIQDFTEALAEEGYKISQEKVGEAFQYGWQKAYYLQRAFGEELTPLRHIKVILEKLEVKIESINWNKGYKAYTEALLEFPPTLNDYVAETIPALTAGYKLAVICNTGATPGRVLRELLIKDNLIGLFDFLTFSDEVGYAKPNPKIFQYTLKHLGVSDKHAAHVGDDIITDVIGAKKAGMTSVWLSLGEKWRVPEADMHIQNVKELLNIF